MSAPPAALCLVLLGAGFYEQGKNALPGDIRTLTSFAERMPAPSEVWIVDREGASFIVVFGPKPGMAEGAVASSSAGYVFNSSGEVVTWTLDVGEGGFDWDRWRPYTGRRVSMARALEFIQQQVRAATSDSEVSLPSSFKRLPVSDALGLPTKRLLRGLGER